MSLHTIPATDALLEGLVGAVYEEIVGAGGYSLSGGEATDQDVRALRGSGKITGQPGAENVSIPLASLVPYTASYKEMRKKQTSGDPMGFRFTIPTRTIVAEGTNADTVAIAANTGLCTFAGSGVTGSNRQDAKSYGPGAVITVGGNHFIVRKVGDGGDDDGKIFVVDDETGVAPANAVAAGQYKIGTPMMRRTFNATVRGLPESLDEGGVMTGTVELSATSRLPDWSFA